MSEVQITHDGRQYSITVDELSKLEKINLAAKAPDDLPEDEEDMEDIDVDGELVQYLVDVTTAATEFEEDELYKLELGLMMDVISAVTNRVFDEFTEDEDSSKRRVKRVRVTQQFIEMMFRGDAAIVAGMPNDVSFENFHYDPSRDELQFIFSSDEWEPVAEGEKIPIAQATVAEIPSHTKEI